MLNYFILTQLTTGGKRDAEIATPINGPAAPSNNANATPVPDVSALYDNLKDIILPTESENFHRHHTHTQKIRKNVKRFEKFYSFSFVVIVIIIIVGKICRVN